MASKSRPSSVTASTPRRYGASCLSCRQRKVRCDANRPTCHPCLRNNRECQYPPSDVVVTRLNRSLETAQARICSLEHELRVAQSGGAPASYSLGETPYASPSDSLSEQAGVGDCGKAERYGATSRFHSVNSLDATGSNSSPSTTTDASSKPDIDIAYHKRWLRSNARFQSAWESTAHAKLSTMDPDVDGATASTLMRIYWTWQAPLHQCIYRRCFFRDLALDGPYFSPFLLNVIYAHACRHVKPGDVRFDRFERGEYFLRRAKQLLVDALGDRRPKVTTIQGLLILGGRQCAVGRSSEGWLYTGMAIRMIRDIGLHLGPTQDGNLSELEPDDLEVRRRLFLSAYAWDKTISLCLGRSPSLVEMPYPPHCILDDVDDNEPWVPFYLDRVEEEGRPPAPGLTELTFSYFVELCKIVHKVYYHVYGPRSNLPGYHIFQALEDELRSFYSNLPAVIRVDNIDAHPHCPPPHVFSLNILYHDLLILLYRPLAFSTRRNVDTDTPPDDGRTHLTSHAKSVCREEASLVNAFVKAYGKTYRFQFQTYLTSYCVYTAATVEILLVADSSPSVPEGASAVERLQNMLQMLEAEVQQTPGIRHSRDMIKARLVDLGLLTADGTVYEQQQRPMTADQANDLSQQVEVSMTQYRPMSSQEDPYVGASSFPPSASDCIYWLDSYIMETGAGFLDTSPEDPPWGSGNV